MLDLTQKTLCYRVPLCSEIRLGTSLLGITTLGLASSSWPAQDGGGVKSPLSVYLHMHLAVQLCSFPSL